MPTNIKMDEPEVEIQLLQVGGPRGGPRTHQGNRLSVVEAEGVGLGWRWRRGGRRRAMACGASLPMVMWRSRAHQTWATARGAQACESNDEAEVLRLIEAKVNVRIEDDKVTRTTNRHRHTATALAAAALTRPRAGAPLAG